MSKKFSTWNSFSLLLTLLLVCSIVLTGCKKEPDKLVIWAFDHYITAAKEAVTIYKKTNPNVEFEIIELSQDNLVQKFRTALASGDKNSLPDIIIEEDYNIKGYIQYYEGNFADLTSHIDTKNYMDFKAENVTYNGKVYGVPYDSGVAVLFYRTDILQQAGLSAEDLDDITWDRFIEIGKIVKEKTGVYMLPISPEGNIEGRIILHSGGSWYYDLDGNLDIKDNQTLRQMMITMKSLFDSGIVYRVSSWDDIISSFYNGNVASVIGGPWWAPIIAENKDQKGLWRVAKIPKMNGNDGYTNYANIGGSSWLVLNKENASIAIDFLSKTLATNVELVDIMVREKQVVTALRSGVSVPNAVKGDEYFGGQNMCELMAKWGESIPPVNYSSHSYEIAYAHGALMVDYLDGNKTIDEILNQLQAEAEVIIAK